MSLDAGSGGMATIVAVANAESRGVRRLLVTGASGYLGHALMAAAPRGGWEVQGTRFTAPSGGRLLAVRDRGAGEALGPQVRPGRRVRHAHLPSGPEVPGV